MTIERNGVMDPVMTELVCQQEWRERVKAKLLKEQEEEIKECHGEEAANEANYGWGDASTELAFDISTKVYSDDGDSLLTSSVEFPSEDIDHDWNDEE